MPSKTRLAFKAAFSEATLKKLFKERIEPTRAVGRDGVRLSSLKDNLDAEVGLIASKVLDQSYKFTRFKDKLISKGAGKLRFFAAVRREVVELEKDLIESMS